MMKRLPPKLLLLSVLVSVALYYFVPVMQLIGFSFNLAGILLVGIGWAISLWSGRVIDAHGTALNCQKKPTALVTTGPFQFSRNPFYLGYFVITIGVAFIFGSLTSFFGPLLFIIFINAFVIPEEEESLDKIFSVDYIKYQRKVRRWL